MTLPITPAYAQSKPNDSMNFGKVRVEFEIGGRRFNGDALVELRFLPKVRLVFIVQVKDEALSEKLFFDDSRWESRLYLPDRQVEFDVLLHSSTFDEIVFIPQVSVVTPAPASDVELSKGLFHIFNFPDFKALGEGLVLTTDGWNVTIAETPHTKELCKSLERQGGYVITHVGRIEREDGSFSRHQLEDFLRCLHYFLSFCLGRWSGVDLPVAFDTRGNRAFEQWGLGLAASGAWNVSLSWFSHHFPEMLVDVFPGFYALWKVSTWKATLRDALYWYLGANDRGVGIGVDTGIILAQTALECLAWTHCVKSARLASEKDFESRGLSASKRLRLLASSLGIPLEMPHGATALLKLPPERRSDIAEATTWIRNGLIHPSTERQPPEGAYSEAWLLSMWLLDLVLLRLCDYQGKYANRFDAQFVGEVVPVPWAK